MLAENIYVSKSLTSHIFHITKDMSTKVRHSESHFLIFSHREKVEPNLLDLWDIMSIHMKFIRNNDVMPVEEISAIFSQLLSSDLDTNQKV